MLADQYPGGLRINNIDQFIEFYPLLFSQKRLKEWRNLFDSNAIMVKANKENLTSVISVDEAMPEQEEYAAENEFFEEKWQNIQKKIYGNIAVVTADYILTTDHEIREGMDVVSLAYDTLQGWKIVSLIYEETQYTTL